LQRFPHTVEELIRALDETFSEVVPAPGDSPDKIFHAAGQRSVVLYLKKWRASAGNEPPAPRQRGSGRPVPA
jgi:hypothetical protein